MGKENAPTKTGKESAEGLIQSTREEEREIEAEKGSDLKKGAARFIERAKSAGGDAKG
jgi:hypothetical protein